MSPLQVSPSTCTAAPARPANKRTDTETLDPALTRKMVAALVQEADRNGRPARRREVRSRVIRWQRGEPSLSAEQIELIKRIAWADPTGEAAVHNALRAG